MPAVRCSPMPVQEQERLIAGYGEANRTAAVQVKALETRLKSKDAAMAEERAALERDLVRAVEAQRHRSADTADKLRCVPQTLDRRNRCTCSFSLWRSLYRSLWVVPTRSVMRLCSSRNFVF